MNAGIEGSFPQRFKGGKKVDVTAQNTTLLPPTALLGETASGLEQLRGKKHYTTSQCKTVIEWRPSLKKVQDTHHGHTRPTGLRMPQNPLTQERPRAEKKHIQFVQFPTWKPEFPIHTKAVYASSELRVQDVRTSEYDFHRTQIGSKTRVEGLPAKRNQLDYRTLGDKPYGRVEYSEGFYLEGGLVAGSTVCSRRVSGNTVKTDFSAIGSYEATGPVRVKWSERVKREGFCEESEGVRSLVDWERTVLSEANPRLIDPDISDGD